MTWLAIAVVIVGVAVLYPGVRDHLRTRRIIALHDAGDYPAALASRLPGGPARHVANLIRSRSGCSLASSPTRWS